MYKKTFDIEFLTRKFNRYGTLKFNVSDDKIDNSDLTNFVVKLLLKYNNNYDTVNAITNKVQCTSERYRSLYDLYRITKYYFPNISVKEFLILFYNNAIIKNNMRVCCHYCNEVCRRVYGYNKYGSYPLKDDLNRTTWPEEHGISFKELVEGIKNMIDQQNVDNSHENNNKFTKIG